MRVCVLTASLGGFDEIVPPVPQRLPPDITMEYHALTDANYAPRRQTMMPRLQARIPKMFGWELRPRFDAYVWMDASFSLSRPDSLLWIFDQLVSADLTLFDHPARHSIAAEAQFIREKVAAGNSYLAPRYAGEDVDGQLAAIRRVPYVDDRLYATMVIGYWNRPHVQQMLWDWWGHTSRYHAVDQLALPFVVWQHDCVVTLLDGDPYKSPFVTYTRPHNHHKR